MFWTWEKRKREKGGQRVAQREGEITGGGEGGGVCLCACVCVCYGESASGQNEEEKEEEEWGGRQRE